MARAAVERDEDFLKKLRARDGRRELPSRIEQIASYEERVVLRDDCRSSFEDRSMVMMGLLKKISNSLEFFSKGEEDVKANAVAIAKSVKDAFVRFGVMHLLFEDRGEDVGREDGINEIAAITLLAFKDEPNCFDFVNFNERLESQEIGMSHEAILRYTRTLAQMQKAHRNNQQNQR